MKWPLPPMASTISCLAGFPRADRFSLPAGGGLLLGVLGVFLLTQCGRGVPAIRLEDLLSRGDAAGFHVLLISLDTVRQDRFGCYGYAAARTPGIDGLCENGVRFDDAVTSVPVTLPAHATLLTGLYPPRHGVRDNGLYKLVAGQVTLAERLRQHGYQTAAFVGAFVLDARFGLDQGFEVYDFEIGKDGYRPQMSDFNERSAQDVTNATTRWLQERNASGNEKPFFLWVHYFDPHLPYTSPLQALPEFADRPYDAEIAFVDQQLLRLLGALDRLGLRERTLIVLVGDHGEALGDHGEATHGMFLYESTLRVPFLLSCPSLFPGPFRVSDRVVGLVDVAPTVEALLGLTPYLEYEGVSLLAPEVADPAIYLETRAPFNQSGWSPLFGLRRHTCKYILAPTPEYYDLETDPAEAQNRHAAGGAEPIALAGELSQYLEAWGETSVVRTLTDEEIERLAALGYVHQERGDTPGGLADPKDMISVLDRSFRAESLYLEGRYAEAADLAREVLEVCDGCTRSARVFAFSLLRQGQAGEAITLLRESAAGSRDVFLIRSLVQALIIDRRFDEAEQMLDLYEEIAPDDGRVPLLRGDCRQRQGATQEALELFQEALRLDKNRVGPSARDRIHRIRQGSGSG